MLDNVIKPHVHTDVKRFCSSHIEAHHSPQVRTGGACNIGQQPDLNSDEWTLRGSKPGRAPCTQVLEYRHEITSTPSSGKDTNHRVTDLQLCTAWTLCPRPLYVGIVLLDGFHARIPLQHHAGTGVSDPTYWDFVPEA